MRRLKRLIECVSHPSVYVGLGGMHGYAAYATGKPEVYAPMAALYWLLALTS